MRLAQATLVPPCHPYRGVAWHGTGVGRADGRRWRATGTGLRPGTPRDLCNVPPTLTQERRYLSSNLAYLSRASRLSTSNVSEASGERAHPVIECSMRRWRRQRAASAARAVTGPAAGSSTRSSEYSVGLSIRPGSGTSPMSPRARLAATLVLNADLASRRIVGWSMSDRRSSRLQRLCPLKSG